MGIAGSPMGSVSLFYFCFFCFLQGALPKESPIFFVGSMMFLNSLPGLLPKEDQNILGKL